VGRDRASRRNASDNPLADEYREMQFDPLMLQCSLLIGNNARNLSKLSRETGISTTTFRNWAKKRTHRPQAATLRFALRAMGYELSITKGRR